MIVFAKLGEALNEAVCFLEHGDIHDMLVMTDDDQKRFWMWLINLLLFVGTTLIVFTASSDAGSKIAFAFVILMSMVKVSLEEGEYLPYVAPALSLILRRS